MPRDPKEFTIFVVRLTQSHKQDREHNAYSIAQDAEELRSIARRLHATSERQCNGYPTYDGFRQHDNGAAERRDERADERNTERARVIAAKYEFIIHIQGDPRGLPLYLGYAGMTANNYNTTGFAVPL